MTPTLPEQEASGDIRGDEPTAELDVEVSYTVAWGAPETPPAYDHGGLPADPDEIDDIRVETVDGKPRPWDRGFGWVSDDELAEMIVEKLDGHYSDMLAEASAQEAADFEEAMDRRYEDQRDWSRG